MNITNAIPALLYKLPSGLSRRGLFIYYLHKVPNFQHPRTLNEKINWRILNDRRPILEWTCDKLAMKEYVESSRAAKELGVRIPRTLWSGTDIRKLSSVDLPEHWVLKPNHRSGQVYFGHGRPDIPALEQIWQRWLCPFEQIYLNEWAYSKARPMLVAEELLGQPDSVPADYKFYVFGGKVEAIQVDVDRYTNHRRRFYLRDWTTVEPRDRHLALAPIEAPPRCYDRMLGIAEELGRPFDHMRVDLYTVDGDVFFGELTPYSGSGLDAFDPPAFDVQLGMKWKLPELNGCTKD